MRTFLSRSVLLSFLLTAIAAVGKRSPAQTVQPVIAEYTGSGKGTFVVTNSSFASVAVLLEPQSFTIDPDGNGLYRPLDPGVHVELSQSSMRLGPRESETVFYKISADHLPAWLTIYATFAPLHPSRGVNLHVMLPHTVYLLSKETLKLEDIRVASLAYQASEHQVVFEVTNIGRAVGRAEGLQVSAKHGHATMPGFPLLPGASRRLTVAWTEAEPPTDLLIDFGRFRFRDQIRFAPAP